MPAAEKPIMDPEVARQCELLQTEIDKKAQSVDNKPAKDMTSFWQMDCWDDFDTEEDWDDNNSDEDDCVVTSSSSSAKKKSSDGASGSSSSPEELLEAATKAKATGNDFMVKAMGKPESEQGEKTRLVKEAIKAYAAGLELKCLDTTINAQIMCNRAQAYTMVEDFGRALRDSQRAILVDDRYVKAYHRGAAAALNLRDFDTARSLIDKGMSWAPDDQVAPFMQMLQMCNVGEEEEKGVPLVLSKNSKPMKVTLVSGFLGSGKTSLLTHILKNKENMKCAVIVNEISEFNVDALSVEGSKLLQGEEKMVEMSNGCICCTLREDLLQQLTELQRDGFDACLIEASGIAEPMQTAETFFFEFQVPGQEMAARLQEVAPLDNCVTVVDSGRVIEQMRSLEKSKKNEDSKDISNLLFDQLEFANVVLLNKIDIIEEKSKEFNTETPVTVESLVNLIKKINPQCEVIPTKNSIVPLEKIVNTGNFSIAFAARRANWMEDVKEGGLKHVPETEEYGVSSMSFTMTTPFHPKKLHDWMNKYFVLDEIRPNDPRDPRNQQQHDHDHSHDLAQFDVQTGQVVVGEVVEKPSNVADIPVATAVPAAATTGKELVFPTEEEIAEKKRKKAEAAEEKKKKEEQMAKEAAAKTELRKARYGDLYRGKGFAWIANPRRYKTYGTWSQAGGLLMFVATGGRWDQFAQYTPNDPSSVTAGQKLIFIGQDLKKDVLTADLQELLITKEEHTELNKKALVPRFTSDSRKRVKKGLPPVENPPPEDMFEDPFGE